MGHLPSFASITALTASLALGACGTVAPEKPVASVKPFCRAVKTQCVRNADRLTDETAAEILRNNRGLQRLCGKPRPCRG